MHSVDTVKKAKQSNTQQQYYHKDPDEEGTLERGGREMLGLL